ncbi:MAG: hypothetical protein ACAI44_07850 [Candidatus Sericytochromatia bacterium]
MGDMRVGVNTSTNVIRAKQDHYIDANSQSSGEFNKPVTVNGQEVFMTKEGKALYEKYSAQTPADDAQVTVAADGMSSWLSDSVLGITEEGTGTTGAWYDQLIGKTYD